MLWLKSYVGIGWTISLRVIEGNNSCLHMLWQIISLRGKKVNEGGGVFLFVIFIEVLENQWDEGVFHSIFKPASARGIGIKVINKWTQIPRKRPVIVQKYLGRPYLINDSKFDMRIYVYVSSYDPLRIYIFEDGLARFASMKYVENFGCWLNCKIFLWWFNCFQYKYLI